MKNLENIIVFAWHGVNLVFWPAAVFWSLHVFNPAWYIPYTWQSTAAFWVLFHGIRIGLYKLRHPEWESPISAVFTDWDM